MKSAIEFLKRELDRLSSKVSQLNNNTSEIDSIKEIISRNSRDIIRLAEVSGTYIETCNTFWDHRNASFVQDFSVGAQDGAPHGIDFKPDGLKFFMSGRGNGKVYEYSLVNPWDISTLSFVTSFSVIAQDAKIQGGEFKSDGTKLYLVGTQNSSVYEYSLSTAWDVSTLSHVRTLSVSAKETTPQGITFKPDGTKMFIAGNQNSKIYEYSLSVAWDISTATFTQDISTLPKESSPQDVIFKSDGAVSLLIGQSNKVLRSTLSVAWDISTADLQDVIDVSDRDSDFQGIFVKPKGDKMFLLGKTNDKVYEYNLI